MQCNTIQLFLRQVCITFAMTLREFVFDLQHAEWAERKHEHLPLHPDVKQLCLCQGHNPVKPLCFRHLQTCMPIYMVSELCVLLDAHSDSKWWKLNLHSWDDKDVDRLGIYIHSMQANALVSPTLSRACQVWWLHQKLIKERQCEAEKEAKHVQ